MHQSRRAARASSQASIFVGFILLASGCATTTPTPSPAVLGSPAVGTPTVSNEPSTSTRPAALSGGTLRVGLVSYPPDTFEGYDYTIDPQWSWDLVGFELYRCCLARTLMTFDASATGHASGELRPDVAIDYPEVSA